jgi:thioester reductase-like protein
MSGAYLITGVPGFIGKRLVEKLAPDGQPGFLLCEPRFHSQTEQWVRELEARGGAKKGQLTAVAGDITQPDLGLTGPTLERVKKEVSDLYHLAAVYDLAVPEELARRVNVLGTGKVLKFIRGCGDGKVRHHYVSTCYVAGNREGMIFETDLDRGQSFKNHYESTKFAAEVLVERSKADIDTRIFRPAIVIGDSRTGETQKFDGPYPSFGAIMMGWMIALPGPGRGRPNLVPVDFIVDAIAAISKKTDQAGKTFALADPNPLSSKELIHLVAERLGAPRPRVHLPAALFKPLFNVKKLVDLSGITPESFEYFNHYQVFDTTNTRLALHGTGVSCPPLPAIINQILRYYRDRAKLAWRFDALA